MQVTTRTASPVSLIATSETRPLGGRQVVVTDDLLVLLSP
jgi:hypothetical protein